MLIIGFGHRARQGKNSAAVAMINAAPIGSEVRMYAYADALRAEVKKAVAHAGGVTELIARGYISDPGYACDGPAEFRTALPAWVKAEDGKPRTLLQWWGTNFRRAQDVNYWVRQLTARLEREQPDIALITDVRFPNEVDAIHAAGGYVVKVTRTTAPDVIVPSHPSEDELSGYTGWDYEINAADLPELRKQAAAIYHKIVGKQ
jgi:hypothetical protein